MEIKIEKIVAGGDGLGYIDGKAHFISGALAGEIVKIEITESKKGYNRGRILEIIEASKNRIEPFCSYFGSCGGCNMQNTGYQEHLKIKRDIVSDIFKWTGKIDLDSFEIVASKDKQYRNRIQVHSKSGIRGFRGRNSNNIIEIDNCPLLVNGLNKAFNKNLSDGRYTFFSDDTTLWQGGSDNSCSVKIKDRDIVFNPGGFFQSNLSLLPDLINSVNSHILGTSVMDLYCGVGLFSAFLPKCVESIVAVEMDSRVKPFIESNLKGKNYSFYPLSLEKYLSKGLHKKYKCDTVIVDPPRKGLSDKVKKFLVNERVKRVIYVSCDPVTMARDIKFLSSKVYRLTEFKCFDFYPYTSHVEAFGVLDLV